MTIEDLDHVAGNALLVVGDFINSAEADTPDEFIGLTERSCAYCGPLSPLPQREWVLTATAMVARMGRPNRSLPFGADN